MSDNTFQDASVDDQDAILTREEYMRHLQKWIEDTRKDIELAYSTWYNYNLQIYEQYYQQRSNGHLHIHAARFRAASSATGNVGVSYVYTVPPMWKRIIAEAIDFMILFAIKLLLTVVVIQNLNLIDIENYGLNIFEKTTENPNLIQMSMEILLLEIVHRFIGCIYETYWITVHSATPGKRYMGLAVLHVVAVANIQGQPKDIVIAYPCTTLSVKDAIFRSLLKNLFVGLLLPICFILMFFKFNRTGYDVITNSLVVEYNPNPPTLEIR